MYGDDTWLKLFPETFDRAEGTSSFFVSVSHVARAVDSIAELYFARTSRKWITM